MLVEGCMCRSRPRLFRELSGGLITQASQFRGWQRGVTPRVPESAWQHPAAPDHSPRNPEQTSVHEEPRKHDDEEQGADDSPDGPERQHRALPATARLTQEVLPDLLSTAARNTLTATSPNHEPGSCAAERNLLADGAYLGRLGVLTQCVTDTLCEIREDLTNIPRRCVRLQNTIVSPTLQHRTGHVVRLPGPDLAFTDRQDTDQQPLKSSGAIGRVTFGRLGPAPVAAGSSTDLLVRAHHTAGQSSTQTQACRPAQSSPGCPVACRANALSVSFLRILRGRGSPGRASTLRLVRFNR